jgi:hypothetical protein
VDTSQVKGSWTDGAKRFNMKFDINSDYVEMAQASSDCSSQMNKAASSGADYIFMPAATPAFLACMRSAALLGLSLSANRLPVAPLFGAGAGDRTCRSRSTSAGNCATGSRRSAPSSTTPG